MPTRPRILLLDVQNVMHAVGELRHIMSRRSQREAIDRLAELLADFPEVWLFEDGGRGNPQGFRRLLAGWCGEWLCG